MVPILAKNAVKIKCNFPNAVMTGNYECAYALGILNAALGLEEVTDYKDIADLKEQILSYACEYQPEEENMRQMLHILKEYEASDEINDQMKELFDMGFADKKI